MIKILSILFGGITVFSCSTTEWIGKSDGKFVTPEGCVVSPEEAFKLAGPWLEETYRLRSEGKVNRAGSERPLTDTIVLRGNWYYVSRDNYPFKTIEAYRYHAVKVHIKTGEVIRPQ